MSEGRREDIKQTGKELALDTFLSVSSDTAADIAKESIPSMAGDILVDAASSLVPGISGAVQSYKRARFERNIKTFTEELKTSVQKEQIDKLFQYVLDYVIDEQQEEKIQYMVNGFVNITEHDHVSNDFVLTYYDVLKELRMVDISVLRLMYVSRYAFDQESKETFQEIMDRHGISYEQYEAVRRNLLRIGVLTTRTDLKITDDLKEISKTFKELYSFLDKLANPKFKRSLPRLKEPKFQSKEHFEISKFGRDFVEFFLELEQPVSEQEV
ncbi:hypothetical protein [Bacillus haynesii]|uniref:hypothetical protein n=1 Tax=Bacillus haynesii TaxID=1925021 RepID=UPI002DB83480|nr:hypothetical protein [Bacillus haynesii]MEC1559706.1 hypothetical protein [Bacillus haynesii]